jgi:hypothetical protein
MTIAAIRRRFLCGESRRVKLSWRARMPLFQCNDPNCRQIFASTAVGRRHGNFDPTSADWTNPVQRTATHYFLYGPLQPPFNPPHKCALTTLDVYQAAAPPVAPPPAPPPAAAAAAAAAVGGALAPAHQPPVWRFPAVPPPRTIPLITYGLGRCQVCRETDAHTISESDFTRWAAEQIFQYLRHVRRVPHNQGFMIGIAANAGDGTIWIAYSAMPTQHDPGDHLDGCRFDGFKIRLYREGPADIDSCRGGAAIDRRDQLLSRVDVGSTGTRSSATCAASKIAKKIMGKLSSWSMTELAYGNIPSYTDGEPAPSCYGCARFLATLLCGHKG